jgi:hypothetical protein
MALMSATTDVAGRLEVRGFFGQYVIRRTDGGAAASFSLIKDGPKELVARLSADGEGK